MKKTFITFILLFIWVFSGISQAGTIYRHIEPETLVQNARIIADGGTIVDWFWMNQVIRSLKELGIYSNCKFLGDANFGYKNATGVTTLYDISGNNNDAVQTIGANQPIWTANQQNGKAGIIYDGNDKLGTSFTVAQPNTIVNVLSYQEVADNYHQAVWGTQAVTRLVDEMFINAGASLIGTALLTASTFFLNTSIFNGASSAIYKDGTLDVTGNAGAGSLVNMYIGGTDVGEMMNGTIITTFVFNIALSTAQRQALENLINTYYAIY